MDAPQIISITVFVITLALIAAEKMHRALAALAGATLIIVLHIVDFQTAITHVDFNTLGVLLGMMLFVAVVKLSGLFEFLAIKCAHFAKGQPWRIMVLFIFLTACLSAFLDNVTTVLLIGPMTLIICRQLDENPVPFFLGEIMASNMGGTATLIGDPPNIMIGSAAGFTFADFILNDGPAVLLVLLMLVGVFYLFFGRHLKADPAKAKGIMDLDARSYIKDERLLRISIVMICLVIIGFMFHGQLGLESSTIALAAAVLILLFGRGSIVDALHEVEWPTLAFFTGLFVIVGALTETGVIDMLANALVNLTGGNVFMTMMVLLVGSALVSSFLDNIPFVATMIPIISAMASAGIDVTPLWWAVSLGACLGGNGTLIGASANVVLADISAENGHPITFNQYLKVGFPVMLLSVAIAAVYLIVRFPA